LALAQLIVGFSSLSQFIPKITLSAPISITKKGSFLYFSLIVVSKIAIVVISLAELPELSILYKGIGEGRGIVFILFFFTNS
jgi:hypothetical protein